MIRPEVTAFFRRSVEAIWAIAVLALGVWMIALGGYLLTPVGTFVGAIGTAWLVLALRRMRFVQAVDAPGVVEVVEAQVGYFGPNVGGFVSLQDLIELRLITMRGRRLWRLKQADGQTLLIPVEAAGAERLFEAFASLPGMNTATLVAALETKPAAGGRALSLAAETKTIWHRTARGVIAGA